MQLGSTRCAGRDGGHPVRTCEGPDTGPTRATDPVGRESTVYREGVRESGGGSRERVSPNGTGELGFVGDGQEGRGRVGRQGRSRRKNSGSCERQSR